MGVGTQKPLKCSEVEAFAEKLIIALAPLMELISQEFPPFQLRIDKAEFTRGIVRELMRARFGRPSTDRVDKYGFKIEYKCINEDGDETEAGIHAFKEGHRLIMHATSYLVARSNKEPRRLLGLE